MKKRNAFLLAAVALLAFAACIDKDLYDPEHANEVRQAQYEKAFRQAFGEIDPNHDWGFGTSRSADLTSRSFTSSSTAPGNFASAAQGVVAYTPTYTAAPAVPEDADPIVGPRSDWGGELGPLKLETGKKYVINAAIKDKALECYFGDIDTSSDGYIDIYLDGVDMPKALNTGGNNSKIRYFILPNSSINWNINVSSTLPAAIYNWGTLKIDGDTGSNIDINGTIENYETLDVPNNKKINVNGTLYTNGNLEGWIKGSGNVYVEGDLVVNKVGTTDDGLFGLSGELYVGGKMSGDININIGLNAHVGSVETDGNIKILSGSQLVVDSDVKAASLLINGEIVVKGNAEIEGDVNISNDSKGYFEKLSCANYTANASDIWVGCSLSLGLNGVGGKFELNGNSNFTLAAGAYLGAKEANLASKSVMTMMSGSFFEVDGLLQLNNASSNGFNGPANNDTESITAIVKTDLLGSNEENFVNTFTGNLGVVYNDFNRETSTKLIDKATNLQKLSDLSDTAGTTKIPETSGCNPGYTGENVKPEAETVEYIIYYKEQGTDKKLREPTTVSGKTKGETVTVSAWEIEGYTVVGSSDVSLTLNEDVTEWTFYYKKNQSQGDNPTEEQVWRIFAEDLGDIGDFDFNDVVFDVIQYSNNKTKVILQAAGGTLPLRIHYGATSVEVHEAFVVGTTDMVNTGSRPLRPAVEIFELDGKVTPDQIRVSVDPVGELYYLEAPNGKAPAKICIPERIQWSGERVNIKDTYPKFADYVSDSSVKWWK